MLHELRRVFSQPDPVIGGWVWKNGLDIGLGWRIIQSGGDMKTGSATSAGCATRRGGRREGVALGMVLVVVLAVSILGAALVSSAMLNAVETSRYLNSTKAFWLAEGGLQRFDKRAFEGDFTGFGDTTFAEGTVQVTVSNNATPPYAEAVAIVQGAEQRIKVEYQYLAPSYNHAIFSANESGTPWTFTLRGTGVPNSSDIGGKDIVMGNIYADGDVRLYEQSMVSNAPAPNTYALAGDVEATGIIRLTNSATVRGSQSQYVTKKLAPDLTNMNYAANCTWDVARAFNTTNVDANGRLPSGHPLRNVVRRRVASGQTNFYFEPVNVFTEAGPNEDKKAGNPLDLSLGNPSRGQVYYVDGHVWFHNTTAYGFSVTGKTTIVSTKDIHISDNLKYANTNSLLCLVALGTYNSSGNLTSGGNVYFGDPTYGTTYMVDAFMFAANNFYYNISADNPSQQEVPDTGFTVYGNYAAMNQVVIYRDWYQSNGLWRAAWYDPSTNRWRDAMPIGGTNNRVLPTNTTFRHYQMIVKYDERIRQQATQPPQLPRIQTANSGIYGGITRWDAYPY